MLLFHNVCGIVTKTLGLGKGREQRFRLDRSESCIQALVQKGFACLVDDDISDIVKISCREVADQLVLGLKNHLLPEVSNCAACDGWYGVMY